jgi:hypothetical protein
VALYLVYLRRLKRAPPASGVRSHPYWVSKIPWVRFQPDRAVWRMDRAESVMLPNGVILDGVIPFGVIQLVPSATLSLQQRFPRHRSPGASW